MDEIFVVDRAKGAIFEEKVPMQRALAFLYRSAAISTFFCRLLAYIPLFSRFFGWLKRSPKSVKKIQPFIELYQIDPNEFAKPVSDFTSFHDFFIRKLSKKSRPIDPGQDVAILPADGRYLAFQNFEKDNKVFVKGRYFSLAKLIGSEEDAQDYAGGALVIARLAPVDYHRFHFPCACTPQSPQLINGPLYSVNPIALRHNCSILTENKRVLTQLQTSYFGPLLFIEVGATFVGSIFQTFEPKKRYAKGDEKGYFAFGASSLILLFQPERIELDRDLCANTQKGLETVALMGQSLGRSPLKNPGN